MGERSRVVESVIDWYSVHGRALPWREPGTSPWGILVSEFMCQQTQVDRVIPKWLDWMAEWPTPADLADASPAEAIRRWDRLGYPRRAKWLHGAARELAAVHGNTVPRDAAALRSLPGVGEYTAAAIQAFAFGVPAVVLDTNVRRVLARAVKASASPPATVTNDERSLAQAFVAEPAGATWSQAVMELGALVCTARTPDCDHCPIADTCAWLQAGRPAGPPTRRPLPRFEGSDRQARGRVLATIRTASTSVTVAELSACWPHAEQRERAIGSLLEDGLIERTRAGRLRLATD